MSNPITTNFDLPANAYLGFDAQNLKEFIKQRLKEGNVFTDQEYEGSNFSALIDVIAYTYHLLLFYLNRTSTEATFTQTQLYENMNRIVKLIRYNPIGYQTACVPFTVTAPEKTIDHPVGLIENITYMIPRFAYINVNGIRYSLTQDISFSLNKSANKDEIGNYILEEFSNSNILFQGEVIEAQQYIAAGDIFETYTLIPGNNSLKQQFTIVDFANFSVYVYDKNEQIWREWTETPSLYLEGNSSLKYEKRLNEAGYYEFRFGNNVNGKQLNTGDIVQIYYLKSDGASGEIGIGQLNNNALHLYKTTRFDAIQHSLSNMDRVLSIEEAKTLVFTNNTVSTKFTLPETVDDIRTNSGKVFKSQSRLITSSDIQTYIERNFSNITSSVYVINNKAYLNDVMSYYYTLGVDSINKDSRISFNQLQFATSCNFNNVYVYMVPKYTPVNDENIGQFVDSNLKQYIVTKMEEHKPLSTEIVPMDPIYIAVGFGIQMLGDTLFTDELSKQTPDDIINSTKLVLTRYSNSHNKPTLIKSQASDIIRDIFSRAKLGYSISTTDIYNRLLAIEGVKSIHTERDGNKVENISLMVWNPTHYNKDIHITTNAIDFANFKYPFFYNLNKIENYIDVIIE